ncbi:hypothetical protein FRC09_006196 [Ceratobasidium sp. 395]|nr:hypothetical protein FRC09_006196 [Ceratobasidium sp. 395]
MSHIPPTENRLAAAAKLDSSCHSGGTSSSSSFGQKASAKPAAAMSYTSSTAPMSNPPPIDLSKLEGGGTRGQTQGASQRPWKRILIWVAIFFLILAAVAVKLRFKCCDRAAIQSLMQSNIFLAPNKHANIDKSVIHFNAAR